MKTTGRSSVGIDGTEPVPVIERGGDLQSHDADELGDGVGGAAAAEHDRVLVVIRADAARDDVACLLAQAASSADRCPDDSVCVFAYSGSTTVRM